jgi:hypothetical protein
VSFALRSRMPAVVSTAVVDALFVGPNAARAEPAVVGTLVQAGPSTWRPRTTVRCP